MTNRLYYDDAYLKEFDAAVTAVNARNGKNIVALDRSAFYPTSGGQPYDTGTLNERRVTDVFVDDAGEVWHEIEGTLAVGQAVHGSIDWQRRFDHMQQHAGDHMIAGAFYRMIGAHTIGLHLGANISTIDMDLSDGATHVSPQLLCEVEDFVNERVQRDMPIRCWFPDAEELKQLPLRKAPTVDKHIRIVAIADYEMVACGGTHPSTTGQVGPIKILDARPERGKLRVRFVAGMRAFRELRRMSDAAWRAANALSTHPDMLCDNVEALTARCHAAERELAQAQRELLFAQAESMLVNAKRLPSGARLIASVVSAQPQLLKDMAARLIETEKLYVLLAAPAGEKYNYVFAHGAGVDCPMGKLLSEAAKPLGGKGGGRPDFAQGGGPKEVLDAAAKELEAYEGGEERA